MTFNPGNISEYILPGSIHEMKTIRMRLEEEIDEEERKDLEFRLWQLEEEMERVTN